MNDEQTAPQPPIDAKEQRPGVINAETAMRLLMVLLTFWTFFSGLALIFFQDGAGATIGGGLEGGEGVAAQRLLGVHLLVLAPIYGLLAWRLERYRMFLWIPFAAQGGVVTVTAYDILALDRDFTDGALPLIVAATFLALLIYVWRAGRRPETPQEDEAEVSPPSTGEADSP